MKTKIFSLLVFFCLQMSLSAYGSIIFRQATLDDLDAILKVYRKFSTKDRPYLVTFPENIDKQTGEAVDRTFLKRDLEKNKIFIAKNDENHSILSLVKLFLVQDTDLSKILTNELNITEDNTTQILAESLDSRLSDNRDLFLNRPSKLDFLFKRNSEQQLFIYYGGAYTVPDQRRGGINTQLILKALESLQGALITRLQSQPLKQEVMFIYGQVADNVKSRGVIHVFTIFTKELINHVLKQEELVMDVPVYHLGYRACKPSFKFNLSDQKLEDPSFPEEGNGMSHLLIFRLIRR